MALVGIYGHFTAITADANDLIQGLAVRFGQLGMEMRPFFDKGSLWGWPLFAAVGGSFGYWLTGVEKRQLQILEERKFNILEKRQRRAEREAAAKSSTTAEQST